MDFNNKYWLQGISSNTSRGVMGQTGPSQPLLHKYGPERVWEMDLWRIKSSQMPLKSVYLLWLLPGSKAELSQTVGCAASSRTEVQELTQNLLFSLHLSLGVRKLLLTSVRAV